MGLSGFDTSGKLRLSPTDPDAPRLLALYPDRYMMTSGEQAAPYLAQLASEGNPTTAAGVYAQTASAGAVPQSWIGSVAEAAAEGNAAMALTTIPHSSGFGGIGNTALAMTGLQSGLSEQIVSNALSQIRSIAQSIYGSTNLGIIRQSSAALENGASGIRPGTLERIVVPSWVARERGFPT